MVYYTLLIIRNPLLPFPTNKARFIGAFAARIGFYGILCSTYNKEPPFFHSLLTKASFIGRRYLIFCEVPGHRA